MASNNISVNDTVQIDGQGYGIVTEVVFRGFATLYKVRLLGSSFEVELERERLTVIDGSTEIYQTTNKRPGRFSIVSDSGVDNFDIKKKKPIETLLQKPFTI